MKDFSFVSSQFLKYHLRIRKDQLQASIRESDGLRPVSRDQLFKARSSSPRIDHKVESTSSRPT